MKWVVAVVLVLLLGCSLGLERAANDIETFP